MDEIIRKVKKRGYSMGTKEIKVICYTDNAIIMPGSEAIFKAVASVSYCHPSI